MRKNSSSFIWDFEKELINIDKHGVDFVTASKAFKDPKRKIYIDSKHSKKEERFFCIGKVEGRIPTVRFSYRSGKIRIIGAGYWRKGNDTMKKKMTDPNKPIGKMVRINDFLPPPEKLVIPQETVKVTISLSKSSVDFFKHYAKQHHIKYQKMIRQLIDKYVKQYSKV